MGLPSASADGVAEPDLRDVVIIAAPFDPARNRSAAIGIQDHGYRNRLVYGSYHDKTQTEHRPNCKRAYLVLSLRRQAFPSD